MPQGVLSRPFFRVTPSGDALAAMEEISARALSPGFGCGWTGTAWQEKQAAGQTGILVALAVLLAYLFLVGLYESRTVPVPVLLSVAAGGLGAVLALMAAGLALDGVAGPGFPPLGTGV